VTNNGSSLTQILIAVSSSSDLPVLSTMEGMEADDFFAQLKREMSGREASFAIQSFTVVE
jgi:hypothetical protein